MSQLDNQEKLIMGVESSCDDSSVAFIGLETGQVHAEKTLNLSNFHKKFGGVVPEIAGREHLKAFIELLDQRSFTTQLKDRIVAVACTTSPGLIGSLLVGVSHAKTIAWILNKPFISIDHIEGHLFSAFIGQPKVDFPFTSFVASGGHTMIVKVDGLRNYEVLGKTTDDAIGEAYDKTAKILGFEYPGGPIIDMISQNSDVAPMELPLPLKNKKTLNFSLSGLKTAVLYAAQNKRLHNPQRELRNLEDFQQTASEYETREVAAIAKGFQRIITKMFETRVRESYRLTGHRTFTVCGGVSANSSIRNSSSLLKQELGIEFICPPLKYCGDNAAMIAYVGKLYFESDDFSDLDYLSLSPSPQGIFTSMNPIYEHIK